MKKYFDIVLGGKKINKMRNIYIFATMFFCTLSLNAQWKVTPEIGTTILKQGGYNAGVGAYLGAGVRYSFNTDDTGFGLISGLYYSQRNATGFSGSDLHGKVGDNVITIPTDGAGGTIPDNMVIEGGESYNISTRRDYLQMPIMAQYAWKIASDIRLHIAAGPYLAVGIAGKTKVESTFWNMDRELSTSEKSWNPFNSIFYNRFDAGASIQMGLEVKKVAFLLNYNTNLYKRKFRNNENFISIGLGYTL